MANQIFSIQLSIPGGVKSPVFTGDKRRTVVALSQLMRGGLIGGEAFSLAHSGAYLQVQGSMVAASATATCASVILNDHVDIGGTAVTAKQGRATGTATCATVLAGTTLTVNGVEFTGVAGAAVLGEATFSVDTSDTACASSIVVQVNAYASPALGGVVKAKSAIGVVTFYAVTPGTAGNSISLASSDGTTLAVSGAVLANGAALTNNQFDFAGTDATTADALAAAINASTTAAVKTTTAVSDGVSVVTVTAKAAGTGGNAITFTSNNGSRLAVTGSGFLASGSEGAVTRWSVG